MVPDRVARKHGAEMLLGENKQCGNVALPVNIVQDGYLGVWVLRFLDLTPVWPAFFCEIEISGPVRLMKS